MGEMGEVDLRAKWALIKALLKLAIFVLRLVFDGF